MTNQRGVTLVELLVTLAIMGVIFIPISMMLIYSLETEKEVSIQNDVQREARFIMEYVTEQMKNKDVYWFDDGTNYVLSKYDWETATWSSPILTFNIASKIMYLGTSSGAILSENIFTFSTIPAPLKVSEDIEEQIKDLEDKQKEQEIILNITESGKEIELTSSVYFKRFE